MRYAAVLLLSALLLAACSREPAQRPPVDTRVQDVAPPPDASLSTESDPHAQPRAEGFSGVLPESYPKDAPPYIPSTLVDFGERWIALQTPDAPAVVRQRLPQLLQRNGWAGGGDAYTKGGRTLRVRIEDARPGTRIVVTY